MELLARSDKISYWIATELVSEQNLEKRRNLLSRFISVAHYLCFDLKNFHTSQGIISGIMNPAVMRLFVTWAGLPDKYNMAFEELKQLFKPQGNRAQYRQAIIECLNEDESYFPFIGILLSDIVMIEERNKIISERKWKAIRLTFGK